jgi:NAD(P)-dependent dehydrogenase (short-subunit alcohol dehydrogenase family)
MGRLGTAKDISNVVSFLASSDCSYMSGESIIISVSGIRGMGLTPQGGQTMR